MFCLTMYSNCTGWKKTPQQAKPGSYRRYSSEEKVPTHSLPRVKNTTPDKLAVKQPREI